MRTARTFTSAPLCLALLLFSLVPAGLHAWGRDGHRITARIAAKHLSGKARARVFDLLKNESRAKGFLAGRSPNDVDAIADAMAAVAMFADEVKRTTAKETREWHFHDLAKDDDASNAAARCPNEDCVSVRIEQIRDALKNGKGLKTQNNNFRATGQLMFLIHFYGDIHQPLHCATNADAGGNCLKTERDFGSDQLHATWDGGLVTSLARDEHGHELTELQVARAVNKRFGARFQDFVGTAKAIDIAIESHNVAFEKAYGPIIATGQVRVFPFKPVDPSCKTAPDELQNMDPVDLAALYDETTLNTVAEQLAKGGFRLAGALNRIFE